MTARKANGEGTIYKRQDGRYEAALYLLTVSGERKRRRVYAATRAEVHRKLTELQARADRGQRLPDRTWRLDAYLQHWLSSSASTNWRPKTVEQYVGAVKLYLGPGLGKLCLDQVTVVRLQAFIDQQAELGRSARNLKMMRTVLSSAFTQAQREGLIDTNPARLLRTPAWRPKEVHPWTPEQAAAFVRSTEDHPLHAVFVLLVFCGLRRGEVVGLRYGDVDLEQSVIRIRQQLQRVSGQLLRMPVKTEAGHRDLPIVPLVEQVLRAHLVGRTCASDDLVFTTRTGGPIEPHNVARSFQILRERAGLPRITLHHLRHTTATMLKTLGVPVRDAQAVLGHASPVTTQGIYQHADLDAQRQALSGVEGLLAAAFDGSRCRQLLPSTSLFGQRRLVIQSGGSSGTRTHDTLLKSSSADLGSDPLTEALALARSAACARLVGDVAVTAAVTTIPRSAKAAEQARFWLRVLQAFPARK